MQSNIYYGRESSQERLKGSGRMTEYVAFAGHVARRHVLSGEDTGKRRRSTGFPVFSTCSQSTVSQPVLSIGKTTATFPVRVMRSKLGETSREATDATYVLRWTFFYATAPRQSYRRKKRGTWIRIIALEQITPCRDTLRALLFCIRLR